MTGLCKEHLLYSVIWFCSRSVPQHISQEDFAPSKCPYYAAECDLLNLLKFCEAPFGFAEAQYRRIFGVLPKRIILVRHAESEGNIDNFAYTYVPDPQVPLVSHNSCYLCLPIRAPQVCISVKEKKVSSCTIGPSTLSE